MIKILFLCGSAAPGKDGVGDYTRRFCARLIQLGHEAQLLSLCDLQAEAYISENQIVEKTAVLAHRIPRSVENMQRLLWVQYIINDFQPDCISLQYVPYSFNRKGLPFWLPSFFKKIKGNHQWHIMFHELWIGMDVNASLKNRIIGFLQKLLILKMLRTNSGITISTQTHLYQSKLASLGYDAMILPLFSNIIKKSVTVKESAEEAEELRFCIFGTIHYGAPVTKFIEELKQVLTTTKNKKSLNFIFIGHCGTAIEEWKKVLQKHQINFEITGFVTDQEISYFLSHSHYGISTTPYILNQKSGSLMAMFDHHIPVLCVARNWDVKGFNQQSFSNLINYKNQESVKEFLDKKFIASTENKLESVVSQFLKGLRK
ncbi:hypothetical protein ACSV4D_16670 [Flavobacterium sp. ARAG 55.4]|uniref:hypothetical protein n=1 Tax=Flavobacterium sp. ARAG 55.4 TaxID=3451357 RepID=UPI003F4867B8